MKTISREIAAQIAQAYLEFENKRNAITLDAKPSEAVLASEPIFEKEDGWVFEVKAGEVDRYICVNQDGDTFSPGLISLPVLKFTKSIEALRPKHIIPEGGGLNTGLVFNEDTLKKMTQKHNIVVVEFNPKYLGGKAHSGFARIKVSESVNIMVDREAKEAAILTLNGARRPADYNLCNGIVEEALNLIGAATPDKRDAIIAGKSELIINMQVRLDDTKYKRLTS